MLNDSTTLLKLKEKITTHHAVVGVVGLGHVGLPFAVEKSKVGFKVIGIEQNPIRVGRVNDADNYIPDVKDEDLRGVIKSGHLQAVTSFDTLPQIDVIVICVPTPLTSNRSGGNERMRVSDV